MKLDVAKAIAQVVRREQLALADESARWVIRKRKTLRVPSVNERGQYKGDSLTCFHERSYTMECKKCRRSASDAKRNLDALTHKLQSFKNQ